MMQIMLADECWGDFETKFVYLIGVDAQNYVIFSVFVVVRG